MIKTNKVLKVFIKLVILKVVKVLLEDYIFKRILIAKLRLLDAIEVE